MSVINRIQELKTVVAEQNQAILAKKKTENETREVVQKLYQAMVQFKPEFTATRTAVEDVEYPEIRGEDMARNAVPALINNIARTFFTVAAALKSNREEVMAVYKELDAEVDDEVQKWRQMRAEEGAYKTAETFRANTAAANAKTRPETPEPALAGNILPRVGANMPPTPPNIDDKKEPRKESSSKPKSPTTTMDKVFGKDPKDTKGSAQKTVKK